MKKKTKHPAPTPVPAPVSSSSLSSNFSSPSTAGSWFGDFNTLCSSTCVPLPSCNLLLLAMDDSIQTSSSTSGSATEISTSSDRCMNNGWPVRDIGAVVVSVLGLVFVVRYILLKSRRMFVAVGRMEIGVLYMIYIFILLLQIFTIGGVVSRNRTFMVWTSALHLGALVCFFWTLIITALVLFQFTDDGTKYMKQFITGTNMLWMGGVVFLSLDLAWNITGQHHGHSSGLFLLTLVFPAVAALLYLILSCIVVLRKLEVYSSLKYVAMALVTFASSQMILFGASFKIAVGTHGWISGSMFALLLDLVSVGLVYKFWNTITDDTWGDEEF